MADIKVQPLGGRVLVKPASEEESDSGLIIPATADKEKPQQGVIVRLGTGKVDEDGKKVDFFVAVGDRVVFKQYTPDEIELDGEEYLVIDEADILAILK